MSLALGGVPKGAKEPVGQKLATLDQQVAQAYGQWNSQEQSSEEALGQLKQQRSETIRSMGQDIQKAGGQAPGDMESMAQCRMMQDQATQEGQAGGDDDGKQVQGPVAEDFVNIEDVAPNDSKADDPGGSFETKCGNNGEEHFNSDNVIAAPGVLNGAHHVHDYVGNEDTNQGSSDESLAAARTTCAKGDQSTHYWPVIRSLDGTEDQRGAVQEGDVVKQQDAQSKAQPQGQRTGDDAGQDQGQEQPPAEDQGQDQGQEQPPAEGQDQGQEQPPADEQDQGQDQGQEQPPAEDQGQDQGQEQPPAEGQDQGQDQGQGQDEGEDDKVGGGQGAEAQPGDGGANDLNLGSILQPDPTIKLTSGGADQVIEMPRFLRIITGDAKSFTNGDANANASWSCEGFEDRQLKDKYPICPEGKATIRTFKFQNCWDGQNTDSGNHRDHMKFSDDQGNCPEGFQNIPQVQQTIKYDIPQQNLLDTDTPFAVDSFPEQLHKPITDHSDFINVMPTKLMKEAVDCINDNKDCPGEAKDTDGKGGSDSKPESPSKPDDATPSDSKPDKPSSGSDSKPDKPSSESGSKQDKPSSESDSKPDKSSSESDSKRDDSAPSTVNRDKPSSKPDSKSDLSTPEAVNRDNPDSETDESTQLAKSRDGNLPVTGSDTPIGLIVGIGAAVLAAGSAQVWWLRRRRAARD